MLAEKREHFAQNPSGAHRPFLPMTLRDPKGTRFQRRARLLAGSAADARGGGDGGSKGAPSGGGLLGWAFPKGGDAAGKTMYTT